MDVRAAGPTDLDQINEIYNHYVRTTAITFDIDEFDIDRRLEWFTHYAPVGRHRVLVALDGDDLVGYATSSQFRPKAAYDPSVETTVYVRDGAHGRGVGGALYEAIFAALTSEDVHRAFAGITQPNEASVALHQRFGFEMIGMFAEVGRKFDRYWDVAWYAKTL